MECIICREDIKTNGTGSCIPCGHIYHAECLIPWLKHHQSCPICRTKSTIDDLHILRIEEGEKKEGTPNDEIQTIARLIDKAKEENSFVIVNPSEIVEFPYIPRQIDVVDGERGRDLTESTETIVRHQRKRVIQAVIGYVLLVALILLIAFVARQSVSDKNNK